MFRKLLTATAIAVMAGTTLASDYCFPSPVNPAGKDPKDIKQYVMFMWDDNAYSGVSGTTYEPEAGDIKWDQFGRVDGKKFNSWDKPNNPLNIKEGDMGMAWAVLNLGNRNGKKIPQTFNMLGGLYVDVFANGAPSGEAWMNYESKLGYYVPNAIDGMDHKKIAVSWGREHEILVDGKSIQPNTIKDITNRAIKAGHEIGNHTTDHMESNSPLPFSKGNDPWNGKVKGVSNIEGFAAWGGNGADTEKLDEMPWGEVINEAEHFGQKDGASAQFMGWKCYGGRHISKEAWKGAVKLADELILDNTDATKLNGFRAPRLEINSGLLFALSEMGYLYDHSMGEGFETHREGENFLWPYTLDNGMPNAWAQLNNGARSYVDSTPAGLWEIPVTENMVPADIREEVYANYAKVSRGAGLTLTANDSTHWVNKSGKICSFDFNMFILWGMTGENWLKTMKHTLDLRMSGNKAPMHYGAHTDYHTPIYDNATLLAKFNEKSFGLVVSEKWNTWETRIEVTEQFVDYAVSKGAEFVTGTQLIENMKQMQSNAPQKGEALPLTDIEWTLSKNEELTNQSKGPTSFKGDAEDLTLTVAAPEGDVYPYAKYGKYFAAGAIKELTHISLNYKTNTAITIRLAMEGEELSREITLTNRNTGELVSSGEIPLSAFDYNQYGDMTTMNYAPIDPTKITGIEIQPLAPSNKEDGTYTAREEAYDVNFSIKDITLYGKADLGKIVSIGAAANNRVQKSSILGVTSNSLKLSIANAGKYSVSLYSINGKMVQSFKNQQLSSGIQKLNLNSIASGIYMIKVTNLKTNKELTKSTLIL